MTKILVANRGEIAIRVIRAARELGYATVQVYSAADEASLAVRLADQSVEIGPPQASKSYLNVDAILGAAKACGLPGDGGGAAPGGTGFGLQRPFFRGLPPAIVPKTR